LLLALTSIIFLCSESNGTHGHILLSHNCGSHADVFFLNCYSSCLHVVCCFVIIHVFMLFAA
jgi:hypothetical protein